MPRYWQDTAKTITAFRDGDPVACIKGGCWVNGDTPDLVQPDPACRPVMSGGVPFFGGRAHMHAGGGWVTDDYFAFPDCDPPHVVPAG